MSNDEVAVEEGDAAGVSSPFAKRQGHCMRWKNISMTALNVHNSKTSLSGSSHPSKDNSDSNNNKIILDKVSGTAPCGQVTAIMGPSGSGKTSLLNILSGRVETLRNKILVETSTSIRLDDTPMTTAATRQKIAFVAQDDSLPVTANPREAIMFSAKLRLPATMTHAQLVKLTAVMLQELRLQECADTVVGGTLVKGLSGGERKRTSVAVELVTQPAVVFCDEPTSGLDSFNALELCQVLRKVALAGSAVLTTIHQPSSEIFGFLDQLVLLNRGAVMYSGAAAEVVEYFGQRGYPCPSHHNPADWILSVALTNSMEQLRSDGFFEKSDDTDEEGGGGDDDNVDNEKEAMTTTTTTTDQEKQEKDKKRVGLLVQVKLLLTRELQSLRRNKNALKARTGMTLMISTLAGIIFYQVAETDFSEFINVQTTFGALLVSLLANVFSTALPALVAFPEERPVFIREYSTNHYSVTAYFLSRFTMELLVTAVQVTVSSALTYGLVGFHAPYGPFWACLYALAMTSTALGVLLGCSTKDPGVAMEFLPVVFMPQILFAGFFAPPDLIPVWLRWVVYVFPLTYATRIVVVNEFDGNGQCQGLDPDPCEMVLSNVEADPDDLWWYWLILLCQCAFFRLLALFILRRKASSFY